MSINWERRLLVWRERAHAADSNALRAEQRARAATATGAVAQLSAEAAFERAQAATAWSIVRDIERLT